MNKRKKPKNLADSSICIKRPKNQKGISTIIATMILILMVVVVAGIVWVSVNDLVSKQIKSSESCFGNFGKITLDKKDTCYNSSSKELQFSVNVGDINLDSLLVSISSIPGTKSFKIAGSIIGNVRMYNGTYGEVIKLPEKNAGLTYVVNTTGLGIGSPDSISIAPIINANQCGVSDSLSRINNC